MGKIVLYYAEIITTAQQHKFQLEHALIVYLIVKYVLMEIPVISAHLLLIYFKMLVLRNVNLDFMAQLLRQLQVNA